MSAERQVSIIIPVKAINDYVHESLEYLRNLQYERFEVLVLPDVGDISEIAIPQGALTGKIRIIQTGPLGPAEKRDIGAEQAKGEILAFLDDDAYPRRDWLSNVLKHFEDADIAAVGGPAVTPESDSFWQKVSGAVYLTPFGGGHCDRYWPGKRSYLVDDWPSVNLLVRKQDFDAVGGFDSLYWPGEDTKLCLDLTHTLNKKIIYDPTVFVWHHRRGGFFRHLRQVGRYGLHRGFFAKTYPETSRRLKYFIPMCFTLFLVSGLFVPIAPHSAVKLLYATMLGLYGLTLGIAGFQITTRGQTLGVALMSLPYIFFTHVWYGLRFMQGFSWTKELKSTLREAS